MSWISPKVFFQTAGASIALLVVDLLTQYTSFHPSIAEGGAIAVIIGAFGGYMAPSGVQPTSPTFIAPTVSPVVDGSGEQPPENTAPPTEAVQ